MDMIKTEHIVNACKSSDDACTEQYLNGPYLSYEHRRETFLTARDGTPIIAVWWSGDGAWDVWHDTRSQ